MPPQQDNQIPIFTPIYDSMYLSQFGSIPPTPVPPPAETQETNNNLVGPEQPD